VVCVLPSKLSAASSQCLGDLVDEAIEPPDWGMIWTCLVRFREIFQVLSLLIIHGEKARIAPKTFILLARSELI